MSGRRADDLEVDQATGEPFVEIAGIKARVVTEAEAETCAAVVCGTVSFFPDDVWALCSRCHRTIVHRPHGPEDAAETLWRLFTMAKEGLTDGH